MALLRMPFETSLVPTLVYQRLKLVGHRRRPSQNSPVVDVGEALCLDAILADEWRDGNPVANHLTRGEPFINQPLVDMLSKAD